MQGCKQVTENKNAQVLYSISKLYLSLVLSRVCLRIERMHGLHNFIHQVRAFMSSRQKVCFQ